jgi:capsular polysaccharide biosynthesis protein
MNELRLGQVWQVIRRRIWWLVLIPVICAIASGLISYFAVKPQYQAYTSLLVNQHVGTTDSIAYDAILANTKLVTTYSDIVKSWTIEDEVIHNLGISYSVKQLDKMIQVTSPSESQVIQIDVTSPNEGLSVNIANALASSFRTKAQSIMQVDNVQVIDPAISVPNPSPVSPNKKLNIIIAFVLGFMASIVLVLVLEFMDTKIRSRDDVNRYLNLPVLAVIAHTALVQAKT